MSFFDEMSDPFTRRSFVTGAAKAFLGVGAMPMIANLANAAESRGIPLRANAKAKSVIYIYLSGGMSHLDTFDTKPGAETQGPVESIDTSVDGIQICEYLPNLAKQIQHVAIVNSMNSNQGAHAQGRYFMHTSYFLRGTIRHPDIGAWSVYHLGKRKRKLPANIKIGGGTARVSVQAFSNRNTPRCRSAIRKPDCSTAAFPTTSRNNSVNGCEN